MQFLNIIGSMDTNVLVPSICTAKKKKVIIKEFPKGILYEMLTEKF